MNTDVTVAKAGTSEVPKSTHGTSPNGLFNIGEKISKEELDELIAKAKAFTKSSKTNIRPLENPTIYLFKVKALNKANGILAVKVGDTSRDNYEVRIKEWKRAGYKKLKVIGHIDAFIESEDEDGNIQRSYFRDHVVHQWLIDQGYIPVHHSKKQETWEYFNGTEVILRSITAETLSQEFYVYKDDPADPGKEINKALLKKFLNDVKRDPDSFNLKPAFRPNAEEKIDYREMETVCYPPFEYQRDGVLSILDKHESKSDSKTLLISGTGSGKSNMMSYVAKGILSKNHDKLFEADFNFEKERALVVLTSAIPDVFHEVSKSLGTHTHFRGQMAYLSVKDFVETDGKALDRLYAEGFKVVVLGVSLQNLAGRTKENKTADGKTAIKRDKLKNIHKLLRCFGVDLVLGDEAHFAMFGQGEEYKAALEAIEGEDIETASLKQKTKTYKEAFSLDPRLGFVFTTATPERILIQDVFDLDENVVYVAPHIIQEQARLENMEAIKKGDPSKSPFFGLPTMNYFALDVGDITALTQLNADKKTFKYHETLKNVFESLFGINGYASIPPLLSEKVTGWAGAGRHILIQVDAKKKADALEKLFLELALNNEDNEYKLYNISSEDSNKKYTKMGIQALKKELEANRWGRSITITVKRAITGVSVDYWDTIIRAKGGNSTTEIQQLWGRGTRRWVEDVITQDEDGNEVGNKYCFKPNVFIIEFSGEMVYEIQNSTENLAATLDDDDIDDANRGNQKPYLGSVFTWSSGSKGYFSLKSLTRLDIHQQLEDSLKRTAITRLVNRIDRPEGVLDFLPNEYWSSRKITGKGESASIKLTKEGRLLAERDVENPYSVERPTDAEPASNQSSEVKDEQEENQDTDKPDESLETKKALTFKEIYSKAILFSILYPRVTNLKTLVESLENSTEAVPIAKNIGLYTEDNLFIMKELQKIHLVESQIHGSMKAVQAQVGVSIDDYLDVVAKLNRVSDNEVFTPGRRAKDTDNVDVARLIVEKLGLISKTAREFIEGDGAGVIDIADKSGSILVEFHRQVSDLVDDQPDKESLLEKLQEKVYAIPTSSTTFELLRKTFETMGWDEDHILWNQELADRSPWLASNWAYAITQQKLKKNFDRIEDDTVAEDFKKWVEAVSDEMFDYCVSNPPYQLSQNGKNTDIWQNFIEVTQRISKAGAFIHPGRWVIPKKNMISTQELLIDLGLREFDYLTNSPFDGIDIDGNITVTYFDFLHKKENIVFSNDGIKGGNWIRENKFFTNSFEEELYKKFENLLLHGNMDELRIGVLAALGGQDFGYRKADQIMYLRKDKEGLENPIKIWANPNFGKGTRFEWFWIDEKNITKTKDYRKAISSRKVMLDKKGHSPSYPKKKGNVFNNKAEIVDKYVIASEKVFIVPVDDTDKDLTLISSLLMTKTARALMSITQKDLYVRGLDNIPLYTKLAEMLEEDNLHLFNDMWFYERFRFSKGLIQYIETIISPK